MIPRPNASIQLFENSRLIRATEFDKLTDLYSPDFFMEYALQYDERNPELIMDALVINFTRFHLLNELKGRRFGDKVLLAIADGIRSVILSAGGIACRYDADTFYVYLPHAENYQKLIETINELKMQGQITQNLEKKIIAKFDEIMCEEIAKVSKTNNNIKGKVKSFRNCDDIWIFYCREIILKFDKTQLTIPKLKIIALDENLKKKNKNDNKYILNQVAEG